MSTSNVSISIRLGPDSNGMLLSPEPLLSGKFKLSPYVNGVVMAALRCSVFSVLFSVRCLLFCSNSCSQICRSPAGLCASYFPTTGLCRTHASHAAMNTAYAECTARTGPDATEVLCLATLFC